MPQVKVKAEEPFRILYNLPPEVDMVILIGGRGGMKTYEVSKFAAHNATIRKRRVAVLRDEKESIRESILNEILTRYDTANRNGQLTPYYERLETGLKDRLTGQSVVFTKGFRASSLQKKANMKGISEVDTAVVEEMEDIRDPAKFNTFWDSVRTPRRLCLMMLNTPDMQHWIVTRYFDLRPITFEDAPELRGKVDEKLLEGYWKLLPRKKENLRVIITSYEMNPHLPEGLKRQYRAYGDPASHDYDLHYYLTAIKGFASSGRKGQVLRKVKPFSIADYLALDLPERFGLDFGTAAPAGIVGAKFDGNRMYVRELNYEPLHTLNIALKFARWRLTDKDVVIADSADPLAIGQLRRGYPLNDVPVTLRDEFPAGIRGLHIHGAIKGPGSVEFGLNKLNELELYFVSDYPINPKIGTTNLWHEVFNYIYAVDKSGNYTNEPIDEFNHLIDPARYLAQSRGRFF